jgi:uncharacterized membrane protein YdjX (TVP38/TMEM64 family)
MAKAPYRRLEIWLLMGLGLGATLALSALLPQQQMNDGWQSVLERIQGLGATGVITFVILYNLATLFLIPGALLTLGGGILYGLFWGSVYVIFAATLGAILAFLIGRYFARDWVCQRLRKYPHFCSIDAAVARNGARVVLLTRLSPIFPFNLLNYAFGVTGIPLKDYFLGSLGMIPGTVMYVYIGAVMEDIAVLGHPSAMGMRAQILQWVLRGIGLGATVAITVFLTHVAKGALDDEINASS